MTALRRLVDNSWFPTIWLVTVIVAWALWAWNSSLGWTVALALAPWLLQALNRKRSLRPTFLDASLVLFLLTAGIGLWAGYDRDGSQAIYSNPVGWQKMWGLLLAALLYCALAATKTRSAQRLALGLLVGLVAGMSMVFIVGHNWVTEPAKWEPITRLGGAIQAFLPSLSVEFLTSNSVGGVIVLLLPFSLGLVVETYRRRTWLMAWGLLTGVIMTLALLLTSSRGAWVGVGIGLALAVAWWLAGRAGHEERRLWVFVTLVTLGGLAGILAVVGIPALRKMMLESYTFTNRLNIFLQAALLVRDYPFTGCGLGNFPLVHSLYALLIHVPIIPHAHSLILDIAIEQGIMGALAAIFVWGGAGWLGMRELVFAQEPQPILAAGLLSLVALFIHGLVDDPIYCATGVPLLWVPAGIVMATLQNHTPGKKLIDRKRWLTVGGILGALLLLFSGRRLAATWYANIGAVAQTRVELPSYDYSHFDNPTLDQIRQREDLSAAEAYFGRALALHPGQVTARTRLAQIALSRGEYEAALEHTQAAWEAGHRDRLTRLLLGDALVAQGRVEEAAAVVRGLGWAEWRLNGQVWYRYWINKDWQRVVYAWQAVLILDPEDGSAQEWIKIAEAKTAQAP